jgi:NAD(P)H-hydrate repair Nnr-like enzyme with NAD(P)H-hydrate dehydratase domain
MWRRPEQLPILPLEQATVVCGCGGATAVDRWLPEVLARSARLVLDADALNAMARHAPLKQAMDSRLAKGQASVLTPHPLEAARLLGCSVQQIQADRLQAATQLSRLYASTIVLKGSGTVIATPGRLPEINITGNGALATAGTGDVLAGWLAGRWSSALEGPETLATPDQPKADQDTAANSHTDGHWGTAPTRGQAHRVACEAVRLHGLAADHHGTAQALRASDLVERMHCLLR